ncbi:MAG: Gfo/Idh/MocA family oxidoreductase [Pseudomonadota bacterium]
MTARVAVIGLGYFSTFHLAAWMAHPGAELIGATDTNPDRIAWAQDTHGATGFPDAAALLAEAPDIIDIVAPPPAHAALIRQALTPGRVIICQKPFCTSIPEAEAVIADAEAADTTLIIHENFRFQPWHRTIGQMLHAGALGQIYQARFHFRPGDGRGPDAYLDRQPAFRTMPRLLIHETAVHFIDLFQWLFGPITHIYADLRQLNPVLIGEDAGHLLIDHAGGTRTVFDGNRLSDHITDNPRRVMGEMWVEGEGGTLRLDGAGRIWRRDFGAMDERALPVNLPVDDSAFGGGCVAAVIDHVVRARAGEAAFENEARYYLSVMRASAAAYRSAEAGAKVALTPSA